MINIVNKHDCVGCNACVQRCPKKCITMKEDEQGFIYPKVDLDRCIDCHLCEKVCPVLNQKGPREPMEVYAAKNKNKEAQLRSSSGGIFFALAESVINQGGVVFGARFDNNWEVIHDYADTIEGIKAFQGSKYVQSRIEDSFIKVEQFLKSGRKVMFTGTPCQVAGLHLFLKKSYGPQLLSVDLVCHGVPSPRVWREYLMYITRPKGASAGKNTVFSSLNKRPVITGISFRDKRLGWEKYGFSVRAVATEESDKNSVFQSDINNGKEQELLFEPLDKNLFMQGFLKDLYLRPSCYACPAKCGKSHSDITLADFWGIKRQHPDIYDEKGVSLVLVNTDLGSVTLNKIDISKKLTTYNDALLGNKAIEMSANIPFQSLIFWSKFNKDSITCILPITTKMCHSLIQRIINRLNIILSRLLKGFFLQNRQ